MRDPTTMPPAFDARLSSAYERGRSSRAWRLQLVIAVLLVPFIISGPALWFSVILATGLIVGGGWFLQRGLAWERGYWVGLAAGLIPLSFAALARPFGHGCDIGGHCFAWCMPACACGAALATYVVARGATETNDIKSYGVAAGATTLGLGALGCSCLSASGALALLVVYLATSIPALYWVARRQTA